MPTEAAIFVTLVVVAFTLFGITLAWAHRQTAH